MDFNNKEPIEIANELEELDTAQGVREFRLLPKTIASDVFIELSSEKQEEIINVLTDKEQSTIINDLFTDDAVDLIEEMPPNVVGRLLKNASEEVRSEINALLKYPNDSAGSIMTTEYVRLTENQTVKDVFETIRQYGVQKETIYTCYVVDDKRHLIGIASIKDLLFADPRATVRDIMRGNVISVHTKSTYKEVMATFTKYGFVALPVVDNDNMLVGIITVDDVLRVIGDEHTGDILKMGAVKPHDTPYLKTSVWAHSGHRIAWLLVLMLSATITGAIISGFENRLATMIALVAFIPMLMDTGGNAGAQTSTQIIRSMALGEITPKNWLTILWKETRVALICGVVLGAVNFVRIMLFNGIWNAGETGTGGWMTIALVVTLSLCCTILIAKTVGGLLPILAKKCHVDPALMAAPLITTIVDATTLVIYFGIAIAILGI